ncbi:MAG: tripartite tricarboxylate transporter substrate-binding protein [Alphaproteobacteria bacterium]|jgi:tripartite-type tricarboxylate transporter receptor subunit TctC
MKKMYLGLAAAASAIGLMVANPVGAVAADFPNKPVIIQVPFAPGGGADRTFRLFAPYLSKELGQPVKVTNVAGGGGWVSWSQVTGQWDGEKDDHKLAVVNIPHIFSMLNPEMKRKETLESFNFLAWHSYDPGLWLVRWDDDRFNSLADVIAYSEKKPLVVSVGSHGGDDHVGMAYAMKAVPALKKSKLLFSDTGDNGKIQQLLGKSSDMVAGNVGYYISRIMERKLKPVAVLHDEPWILLPSVPTFQEVTGSPNITYAGRTLATANGLSEEKRKVYLNAIKATMDNPEYQAKERANRNFLMYREGEEMWKLLRAGKVVAENAAYWEEAK